MSNEIEYSSDMGVELVAKMGDDKMVAQAARVSTLGLENDREKYVGLIKALLREGHWSPFMHPTMTIAFNVPLFVRSQLVTHYSLARSEFSMRYAEAKPKFYVPSKNRKLVQVGKALDYRRVRGTDEQKHHVQLAHEQQAIRAWTEYEEMIEAGIANEVARNVLPQSTYTTLWLTGNLRSWMSFLSNRNDPHAQAETHSVAAKVAAIFAHHYPITFEAWNENR